MPDTLDDEMRLVVMIAEALRDQFGEEIDAHPGGERVEAGSVNRAFRAVVRSIVVGDKADAERSTTILTSLLREAALRRLLELSIAPDQAADLLSSEPALGDAWLAYLALAPRSVIDDLTGRTTSLY